MVKRPNQAVLIEALDEFRDAMRLFIVRIMRRIWEKPSKMQFMSLCPHNKRATLKQTYTIMMAVLKVHLTFGTFRIL